MSAAVHSLWRALPHSLRRSVFEKAALGLGMAAAARSQPEARGPFIVAGALRAPTGLGQAARLLLAGLQAAGREVALIDLTDALRQPGGMPLPDAPPAAPGPGVVLVPLTPPASSFALWRIGPRLLSGKRLVGHWVWEYPSTPAAWGRHAALFHDLLAPTVHGARALAQAIGRPVGVLPYPVALDDRWGGSVRGASELRGRGLADDSAAARGVARGVFTVGFTGDLVAAAGRKNPMACVEAVGLAFPRDDKVRLRLVLGGAGRGHPVRQSLEARASALGLALTIDDAWLTPDEHAARFADLDAYLSLHRAEGFGLTVAEALLAGVPAIVTGAPPMDEIVPPDAGFLVPWGAEPAPPLVDLAEPGAWAAPDIAAAAAALRHLRAEPEKARMMGLRGRDAMLRAFGPDAFGRLLNSALPV